MSVCPARHRLPPRAPLPHGQPRGDTPGRGSSAARLPPSEPCTPIAPSSVPVPGWGEGLSSPRVRSTAKPTFVTLTRCPAAQLSPLPLLGCGVSPASDRPRGPLASGHSHPPRPSALQGCFSVAGAGGLYPGQRPGRPPRPHGLGVKDAGLGCCQQPCPLTHPATVFQHLLWFHKTTPHVLHLRDWEASALPTPTPGDRRDRRPSPSLGVPSPSPRVPPPSPWKLVDPGEAPSPREWCLLPGVGQPSRRGAGGVNLGARGVAAGPPRAPCPCPREPPTAPGVSSPGLTSVWLQSWSLQGQGPSPSQHPRPAAQCRRTRRTSRAPDRASGAAAHRPGLQSSGSSDRPSSWPRAGGGGLPVAPAPTAGRGLPFRAELTTAGEAALPTLVPSGQTEAPGS